MLRPPRPCSRRSAELFATDLTDHIIAPGRALVRAIEALGTIQPTEPFERALTRLLVAVYKRGPRGIVKVPQPALYGIMNLTA